MTKLTSLFSSENYKAYLKSVLDGPGKERGYQSRLAEAAGCQRSYLSQVVHSTPHLTPEHAMGMAQFWKLRSGSRRPFPARPALFFDRKGGRSTNVV